MVNAVRKGKSRRWFVWTAVTFTIAAIVAVWIVTQGGLLASAAPSRPVVVKLRPPTAAELDVLHDAVEFTIRDCMADAGFQYFPPPRTPAYGYRTFPYVEDDLTWAQAHGYGRDVMARLDQDAKSGPAARYFGGLSKARLAAFGMALTRGKLTGITVTSPLGGEMTHSDAGCETQAWQQVYGDAKAWFQMSTAATNLAGIRQSMVRADRRFAAAVTAWSGCMRTQGISAPDPGTLRDKQLAMTDPAAQQRDIAVASTEARCAQQSGFAKTASQLDDFHDRQLHVKYRSTYDTLYRLQLTALPFARSVVEKDK